MSKYSKAAAEVASNALMVVSAFPLLLSGFSVLFVLTGSSSPAAASLIRHASILFGVSVLMFGFGSVIHMLLRIDEALRDKSP